MAVTPIVIGWIGERPNSVYIIIGLLFLSLFSRLRNRDDGAIIQTSIFWFIRIGWLILFVELMVLSFDYIDSMLRCAFAFFSLTWILIVSDYYLRMFEHRGFIYTLKNWKRPIILSGDYVTHSIETWNWHHGNPTHGGEDYPPTRYRGMVAENKFLFGEEE